MDGKSTNSQNYVFYDEAAKKWRCVYEGKPMQVLHESEQDARENLKSLHKLDGQMDFGDKSLLFG